MEITRWFYPRQRRVGAYEMTTVLITQCLQRDFVDPLGPHDPLPNLLHVGYSEADRPLGSEPSAGPMAQLIDWARGLTANSFDFIHIRDWHDPTTPLSGSTWSASVCTASRAPAGRGSS